MDKQEFDNIIQKLKDNTIERNTTMKLEYLDTISVYAYWVHPFSYGEELDTDNEREREEFREFVGKYDSADYHLHFNDEEYFEPYPDYGKLAGTCVDVDIYKVTEEGTQQ